MTILPQTIPSDQVVRCLRPFDVHRDLRGVANLMELCFGDTLDPDGKNFLKRMRSVAQQPGLLRWTTSAFEWASRSYAGFVWQEGDNLVGNVSLIPYSMSGRRFYLIANVAVHPDHRGRGIARALTYKAVEHVQQQGAPSVWLQVREENEVAVNLYRSLGFIERTRRTTWFSQLRPPESERLAGVKLGVAFPRHWSLIRSWLEQSYPPQLSWHLALDFNNLRPGFWGELYRFLGSAYIRQWAIFRGEQLQGVLYWQLASGHADRLWVASPPAADPVVMRCLFIHARNKLASSKTLTLEYPANQLVEALEGAGFFPRQTLIWMERKF